MFELADNKKIGEYLKKAIEKKKYDSVRKFCKACLKERNLSTDDNDELRNMCNRLSQIIKGKKGIQLTDLPVFSKLLDMSCEEILSAGKCVKPVSKRLTNYYIANSKDKKEWEYYINRADQLILNADEYGKTVIEYALEFENYDFLKYLTDNKYIWFVGDNEDDFCYGFGAGARIERNTLFMQNMGVLDDRMKNQYDLRMKMIILAIKHGDITMLDELKAREIPTLYNAFRNIIIGKDNEKYYDEELIDAIVNADYEILEYFSKDFEIHSHSERTDCFVFPFIGKLIERLIERKNDFVDFMLKDAIKHNQCVFDKLTEQFESYIDGYKNRYIKNIVDENSKEEIIDRTMYYYDCEYDFVNYRTNPITNGFVTNIVQVTVNSNDVMTRRLIEELNKIYDDIKNITPIV